jgi:formate dehydrogenase subunit gamma
MDQVHQRDDGVRRAAAVRALAERHAGQRGPLLPVLHAVVAELGHVADDDIPVVAAVLNLSRAEVHGVVSFYHDFRRTPPPEHEIRLCRGEACQAVGAEELAAQVRAAYAGEEDVAVAEVFCLGNCALGPSGLIDGRLLGRLSRDRIDAVLTAPVTVGP